VAKFEEIGSLALRRRVCAHPEHRRMPLDQIAGGGCRYLDDDLVPLREQGICRPFDRQLGANRRFSAGEYWFGGLKTQQTLRPANKPG
jgi:hypothetical protein